MPGALPEGHVLHERAIAPHQRMRGKARGGELAEKGVRLGGQRAGQESRGGVDFQGCTGRGGLHGKTSSRRQFNRPNTATPPCVPTNTLPSAIIGVMNLLPAPK